MTTTAETVAGYPFEVGPELEFFTTCLSAAINKEASAVRMVGGSALVLYDALAKSYGDELAALAPELDYSVFYPAAYRSLSTIRAIDAWPVEDVQRKAMVDNLAFDRSKQLEDIANDMLEMVDTTPNLKLDDTNFVSMNKRIFSCALACFLMNYNTVTSGNISTKQAGSAIRFILGMDELDIPDSTFLNVFTTSEFQEVYPDSGVKVINFVGYTIDDLAQLVTKIRNLKPHAKVQATLSVISESSNAGFGTHHQLVPLEFGPERVIAHDPADYGGPAKEFSTNELLRRWYEAQGYGYLVVHQTS